MSSSAEFLNPSEAAKRLGVSTKALRLYEKRGLVTPLRTAAGWRTYGPSEMARAAEIVALRALRLSLAQVAQVLGGDPQCLEPALAAHQVALEGQIGQLSDSVDKLGRIRADLAQGQAPTTGELARTLCPTGRLNAAFNLPWPWGGEKFKLNAIPPLTYITGPLGSGKTRLAKRIAEILPDAEFAGLDRLAEEGAEARACMEADPMLRSRVEQAIAWLVEAGASESFELTTILTFLEAEGSSALVVDMIEQGLDQASQEAFIGYLRNRGSGARPVFLLTRSCAILDVTAVGAEEEIILCPANHSPPIQVRPYPGAPGYEALTSCLASPEVRARTEGVIALRPHRA